MSNLSSASLESYNRSYPYLLQLHILREIENSFPPIHSMEHEVSRQSDSLNYPCYEGSDSNDVSSRRSSIPRQWDWEGRYHLLAPSVRDRSSVLAVRRLILDLCQMKDEIADNWLNVRYFELLRS
jgi:hypothetical protein